LFGETAAGTGLEVFGFETITVEEFYIGLHHALLIGVFRGELEQDEGGLL
jgi:hypothetical protein